MAKGRRSFAKESISERSKRNERISKMFSVELRTNKKLKEESGKFYASTIDLWNSSKNRTNVSRNEAIVKGFGVQNLKQAFDKFKEEWEELQADYSGSSDSELVALMMERLQELRSGK